MTAIKVETKMAPEIESRSNSLNFRDSDSNSAVGGGGEWKKNISSALQHYFNSEQPILPAPVTDAEAMARVPAASVVDAMLQNYTVAATATTTTIATPGFNQSGFLDGAPVVVVTEEQWLDTVLFVLGATIMVTIMVAAIFGNLLVIASVMRHRKLR